MLTGRLSPSIQVIMITLSQTQGMVIGVDMFPGATVMADQMILVIQSGSGRGGGGE